MSKKRETISKQGIDQMTGLLDIISKELQVSEDNLYKSLDSYPVFQLSNFPEIKQLKQKSTEQNSHKK